MPKTFVDFNELDCVGNDIFNVWRKVGEEKSNFKNTIDKLDWEVKSQERIVRRSQQAVKRLDDISQCLDSYSKFLLNCYSKYEILESFEKIADVGKMVIDKSAEDISDMQELQNYLDAAGSVLTNKQKEKIMKDFENAEEPGKSILIKYMPNLKIDNKTSKKKTSYYSQKDNKLHLLENIESRTVYHESGHAISGSGNNVSAYKFTAYSESMGKNATIYDAIEYDVYWNMDNENSVARTYCDLMYKKYGEKPNADDLSSIISAMKKGKWDFKDNSEIGKIAKEVENAIDDKINGNLMLSDLYGGSSNNILLGGAYHQEKYWDNRWDLIPLLPNPGERNQHLAEEAWAEYFEGYFKNDGGKYMQQIKESMPVTYELLTKYAETLV